MNLTLSLGVDGGGATAKKRKVMDGVGEIGGAMHVAGGDRDRGRAMRLPQARDRMVKVRFDDDASEGGGTGLRLMHSLLSSAAAEDAGDRQAAAVALQEVYRHASIRGGDPVQRVAAYFADTLASRLLLSPSPVRSSSPPAATRAEQFVAFTMFYQASPFYQFAHFTANQAILEAFKGSGRRRLHVVDFDVSYGFQWPSLIQSLSDAAATSSSESDSGDCDELLSLRITGFGTSADELRDTEARLAQFAAGCPNLRFEFDGILKNGTSSRHERIKVDSDETVAVNLVFPAAQNATTSTLAYVRALNPSLVFLIEKDEGGSGNGDTRSRNVSLLTRFAANLRYFAAVFDSLHECLPADSAERLAIERDHLGVEISKAMASRHGMADPIGDGGSWKEMMYSAGFEGFRLSSRAVSQAKLLLKMKSGCGGSGGGFRVMGSDGGNAMSLGWRDKALITATGWRPCGRSIQKNDGCYSTCAVSINLSK